MNAILPRYVHTCATVYAATISVMYIFDLLLKKKLARYYTRQNNILTFFKKTFQRTYYITL